MKQHFNLFSRHVARSLGGKAKTPDQVRAIMERIDWEAESADLEQTLTGLYTELGKLAYETVTAHTGAELAFDPTNPYVRGVLARVGDRVSGINDESRAVLESAVEDTLTNGGSVDDLTGVLSSKVADWAGARAETIALSETANAYNCATLAGYRECGLVETVEVMDGEDCGWTEHDDPDTADGSERTLDEADTYPESHPNCQRAFGAVVLTGDGNED
jgi:hypothetical protein